MLDKLRKLLNLGHSAEQLLASEAYQAALKDVEEAYVAEWKKTKFRDTEAREKAYLAVRALADVDAQLRAYVETAAYERQVAERNT